MPVIGQGILKGLYFPDYDGLSVVNLLASVVKGLGGRSRHRALKILPPARLAGHRKVIVLVVDGLGWRQLATYLAAGRGAHFFGRFRHQPISTVFPATSASALTTFSTGATPTEHAILGWHLNLPDLGVVSTILPLLTRTGMPVLGEGVDAAAYLRIPSYLDSIPMRRHLLSLKEIVTSRYSQAVSTWHVRAGYAGLEGMKRRILAFARCRGRAIAYVYWPGYDTVCHECGVYHPDAARHLDQIDHVLGGTVRALKGRDVLLLVTADHGLVPSSVRRTVDLARVAGLYGCLATLPAGDKRSVFCFVRPRQEKRFLDLVRTRLGDACLCVRGDVLLAAGVFGPGRAHPALASRTGDFVLLAKPGYALDTSVFGHSGHVHRGNHGGMSEAEVVVPLYALATRDGATSLV
ncbi:MAG: alkaline phosphatase family protein [Kiritimatiellae bacterium]|nr:alkaline phosphatase family protein [Kiritimatiellia bacterium]